MSVIRIFDGKRVLITGGTGSLGRVLVDHLVSGEYGVPDEVVVFSRDETKQHMMKSEYSLPIREDEEQEIVDEILKFRIGDVRSLHSVVSALRNTDIVFNAAALKQVPNCEYYPFEAVETNIRGAENLVRAIREFGLDIETVVGVSTDKACKPVNVMGMTKAIQERLLIGANLDCRDTRFVCVRYGNVLASRGSVIPLLCDQIRRGGPVTITDPDMTRFLLSLSDAVKTIFSAVEDANRGDTYIPKVPSARVNDVADALIGDRPIKKTMIGIRPGEKIHEILVSEEEARRTVERGSYYVILPILPEVAHHPDRAVALKGEYSSSHNVMTKEQVIDMLCSNDLSADREMRLLT